MEIVPTFSLHVCEEVKDVCAGNSYACAGIPARRIKSLVASGKGPHLCVKDESLKKESPFYRIMVVFREMVL